MLSSSSLRQSASIYLFIAFVAGCYFLSQLGCDFVSVGIVRMKPLRNEVADKRSDI